MKQIRKFCIKYTVNELTWYNQKTGRRYILPHKEDVEHFSYYVGKSQKYYKKMLKEMGANNISIVEKRVKVEEGN